MKPSDSAPATKVGQVLSIDLKLLSEPSHGGNTQMLTAVDELTGYTCVIGSKTKSAESIMAAIKKMVATFRVYGHSVEHIHCDAESTLVACKTHCALMTPQ